MAILKETDLRQQEGKVNKRKKGKNSLTSNYSKFENSLHRNKNPSCDTMACVTLLCAMPSVIFDVFKFIFDLPSYLGMCVVAVFGSLKDALLPRKRKELDNETILITGAATGIGRDAVLQLAKVSKNVTFVLWDINEKGLLETSEKCRELGVTVFCYVVDLSQHEDVINTAKRVRDEVGDVTILFNNAGLVQFNTFLEVSPKMEKKILEVNLLSYMWIIREFLPGMIERGSGHIVSTCSGLAHMRFRYLSAYVASKHGLKAFLDCLKLEMRIHPQKPNIKFSTVYPGFVATNMTTGITWEPRYKTWQFLQHLDSNYMAEKIIDGILKEKEEIMVPGSIRFIEYFYGLIPTQLMDRMENALFQNMKIVHSSTNSTVMSQSINNKNK